MNQKEGMMERIGRNLRGSWLALVATAALVCSAAAVDAKTLNFGLSGNPDSLDPHKTAGTLTFQTAKSIYDTLVEPDPSGKIVPALAEKWEVSNDELVWTFHLRKGVVFHNGDKLSAQDVKASFVRVMDKNTAAPKAAEFSAIVSIETPADHTVVINLKEPTAPLLATLASGWAAILPQGLIASGHDFATKPVGTGPFKLKEWVRDNRIVLVKNPNYWMKGLPKLDQVVIHIIPERSVKVQGIVSGQLHVADIVDKDDVPAARGQQGRHGHEEPDLADPGHGHELQPPRAQGPARAPGHHPRHRQAESARRGLRRRQAHRHLHGLQQRLLQGLHRALPLRPGQGQKTAGRGRGARPTRRSRSSSPRTMSCTSRPAKCTRTCSPRWG